jgi:hypothetical protein
MSDQNKQFDEYIKSKLHDLDRSTPPPDWEAMEGKLESYYAYRRRVLKLKLMEVSLVLLLLLTIVQYKDFLSGTGNSQLPSASEMAQVDFIPKDSGNNSAYETKAYSNEQSLFSASSVQAQHNPSENSETAINTKQNLSASVQTSSIASNIPSSARSNEVTETKVPSSSEKTAFNMAESQSPSDTELVENSISPNDLNAVLPVANVDNDVLSDPESKSEALLAQTDELEFAGIFPFDLLDDFNLALLAQENAYKPGKLNIASLSSEQQVKAPRSYFLLAEAGASRLKNFSRTVNHHRYSEASSNASLAMGAGMSISEDWYAWLRLKNVKGAFMPNSEFDYIVGSDPHDQYSAQFDSAGINMTSLSLHLTPKLAANERAAWYFMMGASVHGITHATYNRRTYSLKPIDDNVTNQQDMRDKGLLEGGDIQTNLFASLDFGTVITYRIAHNVSMYINPIIIYPLKGIGAGNDLILVTQWSLGTIYHLR